MPKYLAYHIVNARLICPEAGYRAGCDIVIRDGHIADILPAGSLRKDEPDVERIDARGGIVQPGFVNTHNHSPLTIVRGMVEDRGFAPAYTPGVPQGHWLSEDETLALARLGVLELLCAGSTTVVDYYRMPQALARAAEEIGVRAQVGGRVMDADTAALAEGRFVHDPALGEATLAAALDLVESWDGRGNGRISTILAPHAPDTCSREMLTRFAELAAKTGKQVHTHLAQSVMEVEQIREREGMSPVEFLEDTGLLNEDLVAAHCIYLPDEDIQRAGGAGIAVAHAPIGNAAFGAAAPIVALRDAGARITLCTDTKSADMFEAMRYALSAARSREAGKTGRASLALNAREVFGWATSAGAKALKGHGATGTLKVGDPADLVVLDADAPNLAPVIDGFGIVVHSGSGANVRTVFCDGECLLRDGRPTRVDASEVIATAQAVADRLWARAAA
ncbi:amidohydrolase family protein [Jiella marina]|uniref:amidohydrolase family protein n=1 Tax=Jiella sp. LLJ827 TaxID=2917712 RepID=UPI00210174F5|nr:amidohydrolase family protein [Jiella sp. LLJ827]MCQ0986331.1 amidohydrolase family protein [Jiella sp. LLJ827]